MAGQLLNPRQSRVKQTRDYKIIHWAPLKALRYLSKTPMSWQVLRSLRLACFCFPELRASINIQYQYKAVLILILNSNSVLKRYWILNTCQAFIQIWGADRAFEPCVRTMYPTKASTQINTTTSLYCPFLLPLRLSIYLMLLLYTILIAINKLVTPYKSHKIFNIQ